MKVSPRQFSTIYDVVYVSGSQYHRVISVGISVGARFPAHCTANGRVLLAAQPEEKWPAMLKGIKLTKLTANTVTDLEEFRNVLIEVRDQGWSMVDQELEIGLMSISVPLTTSAGVLVGAINVGGADLALFARRNDHRHFAQAANNCLEHLKKR